MEKNINVGIFESICIITTGICMQVFLNLPMQFVQIGGTAAWLAAVYTAILSFIVFFIVSQLFKRFPNKDIYEIGKETAGKAGQIIIGIVLAGYSLFAISIILREFSEDLKTIVMPLSPLSLLATFFIISAVISVNLGLETLLRVSAVFVPIITVGYFIIIFGVSPYYDFTRIMPILGSGLTDILGQGFPRISLYTAILILYLLAPFLKTYDNFKKVGYWTLGLSNFFIITSVLAFTIVIPYPTSSETYLPIYALSRLIHVGRFFDRVESVFMPIWVLAAAIYLSIAFFVVCYSIMKGFDLPSMKPLIIPVAIIAFTLSFISQSIFETFKSEVIFRTWGMIPGFGLPILLLLIAIIRKKGSPQSKSPPA